MKTIDCKRLCIGLVVLYGFLHFMAYMHNLLYVSYEQRNYTTKELFEGPLLMKDISKGRNGGKVISGVYVVNAKSAFDQPLENGKFKKNLPTFNDSSPLPHIPTEFLTRLAKVAAGVVKKYEHFAYFTFVNGAYEDLTMNWLCNIAPFNNSLERTIIVSTDSKTCKRVKKDWKQVNCLVLNLGPAYEGSFEWGKQQYINILTIRAEIMYHLAIKNVPYVLVETDAVWFRDPLQFFIDQTIIDDADIVVPRKGHSQRGQSLAFDPMIVYPKNATIAMFKEMVKRLKGDKKLYDQDVMEELCRQQYFGVVCREFEWAEIGDGKWFKMSENERLKFSPYIVNNNYYVGVENKMTRQAINGMWLLSKKGHCLRTKTEKLLKKYGAAKKRE